MRNILSLLGIAVCAMFIMPAVLLVLVGRYFDPNDHVLDFMIDWSKDK